jgi:hypothetical protein
MGLAERLLELEPRTPWHREDFRAGLAALSCSAAAEARQFAADWAQIAGLAAMVLRCPGDDTGGTPWTSFRREIAVARSVSDPAALALVRARAAAGAGAAAHPAAAAGRRDHGGAGPDVAV